MTTLSGHLDDLLAFLDQRGLPPPTRRILIVEIEDGSLTDGRGRLRVKRQAFLLPESFEERFGALLSAKRRWVNLSCIGIDGDSLIVSVEPGPSGATSGPTSVNYSGPAAAALQNGWRASESLLIE